MSFGAGTFSFGSSAPTTTAASAGFGSGTQTNPAFSFGANTGQQQQPIGFGAVPATTQSTATPAFSFGQSAVKPTATATSLPFGTNSMAQTTAPSGFNFASNSQAQSGLSLGLGTDVKQTTGFTFTNPSSSSMTTAVAPATLGGGFQLGTAPPTSLAQTKPQASTAPIQLGGFPGTMATGGLQLGTLGQQQTVTPTVNVAATITPNLGVGTTNFQVATTSIAPPATSFQLGPPNKVATPTTGFQLGTPSALTQPKVTAPATTALGLQGFQLGGQPKTTTTGLLGATTAGGSGFSFPLTGTAAGGLSSSKPATASSGSGLLGGLLASTTAPSTTVTNKSFTGLTGPSQAAITSGTTTATTTTSTPASTMTYRQLEESINKWTLDLEEQEKIFLQQASEVNNWDKVLIQNGEKITSLHNDMEKVKTDQKRLSHELDYVVAQQRELEDMLIPLEESVKTITEGTSYKQHTELERESTYQMAETIDSQLKLMVKDLKEIIEHMNTANTPRDTSDPLTQIAKILNAHMNSLQWIDQTTSTLETKVDGVSRLYDLVKRDQERNVHLAFD